MPLKRTKSELKNQRESLKRFQRYLPTLQLKKQQLQSEVRRVEIEREELGVEQDRNRRDRQSWIGLFAEDRPLADWLEVKKLSIGEQHIAGVDVPVLLGLEIEEQVPDRASEPVWIDEGLREIKREVELEIRLQLLVAQENLLKQELRTTSQRVNLFEKIKIPECKDNIRIIRIALGDEQVAAVARGKLAKKKNEVAA